MQLVSGKVICTAHSLPISEHEGPAVSSQRAGLRPLLRCASFTRCARPSGWPAAITSLRFVYSLRSPFGLACGHYFAALRLLAALALRAGLRPLLRCASFIRKQNQLSSVSNYLLRWTELRPA